MSRISRIRLSPAAGGGGGINVVLSGLAASTAYGTITVDVGVSGVDVVLSGQATTAGQAGLTTLGGARYVISGQFATTGAGNITVDEGEQPWTVDNVDLDNSIVEGQTGVIVAINGTIAATGKKIFLVQGADYVEQTVTAEDSSSATITVTYGGVLSAGAATLCVRNPL